MSRWRAHDFPVFDKFIGDLRAIWAAESENGRRMERRSRCSKSS